VLGLILVVVILAMVTVVEWRMALIQIVPHHAIAGSYVLAYVARPHQQDDGWPAL